jgi:hypothetical protein
LLKKLGFLPQMPQDEAGAQPWAEGVTPLGLAIAD